ncbi:MAG TPA: 1-(5-phosphoribosyl)-5-[(5-phosphoribosylamino)methylideneamino] imidazole-4-carboxamide isomerase [Bacteroidota bacterium]|nr:1-(5-phosphoribosyl)-5-[(5-phosphoribosylamino)methylideneamino] imidazole-4-carboxamide isomerase [Bacteroidota bacterium]
MILIIPAIEISGGRCVRTAHGEEGIGYSDDPVEMARLWRTENAKSLHVTDLDGAREGRLVNTDSVRRMVQAVDIPIELGGGLRSFADAQWAFETGVYRVLISAMLVENPDEAGRLLTTYGPSKVVLAIYAMNGTMTMRAGRTSSGLTTISAALNAKALGFRRLVYADVDDAGVPTKVNLDVLRELGEKTGMRITSAGGVTGLEDLLRVQELEPFGVDSVVVGRSLYENKFACQALWRKCEAGNYPYTARI